MTILFIYDDLTTTGGIQTFLVRVTRYLSGAGHRVLLLTDSSRSVSGPLFDAISAHAEIMGGPTRYFTSRRTLRALPLPDVDVVYGCNLQSFLLGLVLKETQLRRAAVVAGVYHPREYCWRDSSSTFDQRLGERVLMTCPEQNVLFPNDSFRTQTARCIGRDLGRSPVVNLPVDVERFGSVKREPRPGRLVSVARLADYYTHHWHCIDAIAQLEREGIDMEYHVYGSGPSEDDLREYARGRGVQNSVFLHGWLPYEEFADAVRDCTAFIGGGTALVEAAACGVPCLVTIDAVTEPLCYGLFHETEGNDIGAYVEDHATYAIADCLRRIAAMDRESYTAAEHASRERAGEFGLDRVMPQFVAALEYARPFEHRVSLVDRARAIADRIYWRARMALGAPNPWSLRYSAHGRR